MPPLLFTSSMAISAPICSRMPCRAQAPDSGTTNAIFTSLGFCARARRGASAAAVPASPILMAVRRPNGDGVVMGVISRWCDVRGERSTLRSGRDTSGGLDRRPARSRTAPRARCGRFPARSRGPSAPGLRPRAARQGGWSRPSSRWICEIRSKIVSATLGASPIDGSSSIRSRGAQARPRPIASICCSPPDRVPAIWPARSARIGNSVWMRSSVCVHCARPFFGYAPISRFSRTVSVLNTCRPSGTWAMPRCARSEGRRDRRFSPPNADRAGHRRNHPADRLEQGRLSGAVRADEGDESPLGDGQGHVGQGAQAAVGDGEVAYVEHAARPACYASRRASHFLPR